MAPRKRFYGYAVIRTDDKKSRSFTIGKDQRKLREKFREETEASSGQNEVSNSSSNKVTKDVEVNHKDGNSVELLLRKVSESITSQFELLFMTRVIGPFIQMAAMDQYMIDPALAQGEILDKKSNTTLVGLSEETYRKIYSETDRIQRIDRGTAALPSALLLSIVATFDSNMVDIIRNMLKIEDKLHNFKDKSLDLGTILSFSSIEDIRNHVLDSEIYSFSRGSHAEQVKFIEDVFDVGIKDSWPRWPEFIEIFERRNLIAHGEKTFTRRYIQICAKHGLKNVETRLNEDIEIEPDYLLHCIEILLEFSVLAIFTIWRKHNREQESQAFSVINNLCVDLIANKRYVIVVRILEFVLSLKNTSEGEPTRRRLIINLASAYRHLKQVDACNKVLSKMNWEVCSEDFRICVAALKGDVAEFCKLISVAHATGSISRDNFIEWPVFSFVRNEPLVQKEFTKVYGGSISQETSISRRRPQDESTSEIDQDADQKPDDDPPNGALH